jgi:hypothetical protein
VGLACPSLCLSLSQLLGLLASLTLLTENLKISSKITPSTVQILVWRGRGLSLAFYCFPFPSFACLLFYSSLLFFSCSHLLACLHLLFSFSSLFSRPYHCFHSPSLPCLFFPSFRLPDKDLDIELLKATYRLLLCEMGTINL